MRDVLIPMDQNEANWGQRCNEKLGRLAAQDTININDVQKLYMNSEIFDAVKNGDPDDFVTALDRMLSDQKLPLSVIFNQVTAADDSMLHVAAQFGREKIAELIASRCPSLLSRKNIKGDTALHVAAKCNNSNVIAVILTLYDKQRENCHHGDDEDKNITRSMNNFGSTALHLAVRSRCLDGVTQLFNKDNSVAHYLDKQKRSPLYEAVVSASISNENDRQIIYCLLKDPFLDKPSFPSRHAGRSPIHAAIDEKNSDLLKDLIEKSQGLKLLRDEYARTPLHYAAFRGYLDGVRILLKESPETALQRDDNGNLPVHLACICGNIEVVKEFLEQEWPNAEHLLNQKGQNILHVAAMYGRYNVVKYVLKKKEDLDINLNEPDENGDTPLHIAAKSMYPKVLFYLTRDRRIHVNSINIEGLTPLDVVLQQYHQPRSYRKFLSDAILYSAGASLAPKRHYRKQRGLPPKFDLMKDLINTLMLVAILIATVSFAAGFTVPGGTYDSDDNSPHKMGMAVLVNNNIFKAFMICNTTAMYSSIVGSFFLLWAQLGNYHLAETSLGIALHMVALVLVAMSLAFMFATFLVVRQVSWLAFVIGIIGFISIVFVLAAYLFLVFPFETRRPLLCQASKLFLRIIMIIAGSYEEMIAKELETSNSLVSTKGKGQVSATS